MQVQVISFYCVLKNIFGTVLSESYNNNVLMCHEHDSTILKGLIDGLQNIKIDEKRTIFISAKDGYGFYQTGKIKRIDILLARHAKVGDTIYLESDDTPYKVLQIENDKIILDGNHPLAGQDLIFEVKALNVRTAKVDEFEAEHINIDTNFLFH